MFTNVALAGDLSLLATHPDGRVVRAAGNGYFAPEGSLALRQISAGANGSQVWGTAADDSVWEMTTPAVQQVPGGSNVYILSEAADGTRWATLRSGQTVQWVNNEWVPRPGPLGGVISVGSANNVWMLDGRSFLQGGFPWRWNGSAWERKGNELMTWIDAAADGTVTGTMMRSDSKKTVRWNGGGWDTVAGPMFQTATVSKNLMYGTDLVGLYEWTGKDWRLIHTGQGANFIAAAPDGTLIGCLKKRVCRFNGFTGWEPLPFPEAFFISAASSHAIYAYDYNAPGGYHSWSGNIWQPVQGFRLKNVSIGADNTVCGIGTTNIAMRRNPDGTWRTMEPEGPTVPMTHISVGSAQWIAGLDLGGSIRRFNGTNWDPPMESPAGSTPLQDLSIGADGTMVLVDTLERAYCFNGTQWHRLENLHLVRCASVDANHVAGISRDRLTHDLQIWLGSSALASAPTLEDRVALLYAEWEMLERGISAE